MPSTLYASGLGKPGGAMDSDTMSKGRVHFCRQPWCSITSGPWPSVQHDFNHDRNSMNNFQLSGSHLMCWRQRESLHCVCVCIIPTRTKQTEDEWLTTLFSLVEILTYSSGLTMKNFYCSEVPHSKLIKLLPCYQPTQLRATWEAFNNDINNDIVYKRPGNHRISLDFTKENHEN